MCVNRLHGDRAKELLSNRVQQWCTRNNVICTLGGGDDPANNGHVESEIGQLKRRLRLVLRQAGHTINEWPQALRWVAEDRLRHQLSVFGIQRAAMIPYNASVVVKRKRWHDAGVLAPPYVNARILASDPHMFDGWVVETEEGRILHVREALVPNPLGEMVALELKEQNPDQTLMEESRRFRMVGKQKPPKTPVLQWPLGEGQGLVADTPEEDVEYAPTTPSGSVDLGLEESIQGPKKLFGGESGVGEKIGDKMAKMEERLGENTKEQLERLGETTKEQWERLGENTKEQSESIGENTKEQLEHLGDNTKEKLEKTGEGEKPYRVIRTMKLSHLEDCWNLAHKGVLEEIRKTLETVPMDEEMGSWCGKTLNWLSKVRGSLEKGLGELNKAWENLGKKESNPKMKAMQIPQEGDLFHGQFEDPESPEEVLQTVTVGLNDVRRDLKGWVQAMKEEYNSLVVTTQAVEPVGLETIDQGSVEFVPGKLVCVVKAGPNGGKKKCRGVICGNMMESDASPIGVYASGADGTLIRTVLRHSVLKHWGCTITDIKTAFLLAPRVEVPGQREVVVVPPRILVEAGVCPSAERWRVRKALYGLPSSPACWALHRDKTLKNFSWWDGEKGMTCRMVQTPEGNLWKIMGSSQEGGEEVLGHLLVYVDDMMVLASESVRKGFMDRMTREWKCTPGETVGKDSWSRFSGFELKRGDDGISLKVSQVSYIQDLLKRHDVKKPNMFPMPKCDTEQIPEEEITSPKVREAQMYVGELLWASVRSRPDIAFTISVMGQQVTKRPEWVVEMGKHVLGFLLATKDHCLHYKPEVEGYGPENTLQIPRHEKLIEAYSDISFAPNGNRSYQGVIVTFAGAPVQWEANRQAFCTLSTAESELMAALEAMTMSQSVEALLQSMYPGVTFEKVLYGDNQSALSILEKPDGSWRTRHLRLRANVLRERLRCEDQQWRVRHQRGTHLVADLLTKPICQSVLWDRFWRFLEFDVADFMRSGEASKMNKLQGSEFVGSSGINTNEHRRDEQMAGLKTKIAKVGLLMGLLGQIPANDCTGEWTEQCKNVLMVVLTVVVAVFTVQLLGLSKGTGRDGETVQQSKIGIGSLNKLWCREKTQEEITKEEEKIEQRVAREDEPAPKLGNGSRENEPGSYNEDCKVKRNHGGRSTVDRRKHMAGRFTRKIRAFLGAVVGKTPGRRMEGAEKTVGEARVDQSEGRNFEIFRFKSVIHYCPTGCPSLADRSGGAMDTAKSPSLAAMRVANYSEVHGEPEGDPWTRPWFDRCPGHGKDQWIETLRSEGWLVRSHATWPARTFHPLHKTLPLEAKDLTGVRVSVGFDEENNKVVRIDDWMTPTSNLFEPKKQWKGWTFLQLKRPSENNYGGKHREAETVDCKEKKEHQRIEQNERDSQSGSKEASSSYQGHGQGKGYAMGSATEKGVMVANQLPKRPSGVKEIDKDEDGSEWAWVTDYERVG